MATRASAPAAQPAAASVGARLHDWLALHRTLPDSTYFVLKIHENGQWLQRSRLL